MAHQPKAVHPKVILVVDDDESVRSIMRAALEREGYTVVEAANGSEALRLLHTWNRLPDLVITDLAMPDVSGEAFIEALQVEGAAPSLLLISGYNAPPPRPAGAYPFLKKPFTHAQLAKKVRACLEMSVG